MFFKAVKVLGELLENESIAIYSVGKNKGFVRLEASSRAIMRSVPQALRMQSLESALAALEKGDVWVNTQFLPDMPAYLACARENGETVLLIEIVQAKYTQVIKPYAFSKPDIQYIGVTEETYDALAQAVPGLIEQYHQDYRESLEKPMLFYIGVPQTDGGRMNLIWDAAYDFDAEDITYHVTLARDYLYQDVLFETETRLPSAQCDMPEPGQYFLKVMAANESGYTQDCFDYYVTDGGKVYGTFCFYILEDGRAEAYTYEE